jgi:hypothetical protein
LASLNLAIIGFPQFAVSAPGPVSIALWNRTSNVASSIAFYDVTSAGGELIVQHDYIQLRCYDNPGLQEMQITLTPLADCEFDVRGKNAAGVTRGHYACRSVPGVDGTLGIGATSTGGIITSLGSAGAQMVWLEVPTGTVDGINDTFTLNNPPDAGKIMLFVDGTLQREGAGNDFTVAADVITFEPTSIPVAGASLLATYQYT